MRKPGRAVQGTAVAATGVLAMGLLAGCNSKGGDSSSSRSSGSASAASQASPASVVKDAHSKTAKKGTARMRVETTVTSAKKPAQKVDSTGVVNLRNGDSQMTSGMGGQKLQQRVVHHVLYQKLPKRLSGSPSGTQWMKLDLNTMGASGVSTTVTNPSSGLGYTKGMSGKGVTKVGTDTLDGTKVTHYQTDVDTAQLAKVSGGTADTVRKELGSTIPMDVWADQDGVLRKVRTQVTSQPNGKTGSTGKSTVTSAMYLSDFGTTFSVQAPPAH